MSGISFRQFSFAVGALGIAWLVMPTAAQSVGGTLTVPAGGIRWGQDSLVYSSSGTCTGSLVDFRQRAFLDYTSPGVAPYLLLSDGVFGHELGFANHPETAPCIGGQYQVQVIIQPNWFGTRENLEIPGPNGLMPGTYSLRAEAVYPLAIFPSSTVWVTPWITTTVRFDHPYVFPAMGVGLTPVGGSARSIGLGPSPVPLPNLQLPQLIEVSNTGLVGMTTTFSAASGDLWVYDQAPGNPLQWRAVSNSDVDTLVDGHTQFIRVYTSPAYIAFSSSLLAPPVMPQADMWWGGEGEAGWGLSIGRNGDALFVAGFLYDYAGKPTWGVMQNGSWDPNHTAWTGDVFIPHGAPLDAYDASKLNIGNPAGKATLSFTSPTSATFQYLGGYIHPISRYAFNAGDSGPYHGYWWGGASQNGWGLHVAQQGDAIFATWYTYGADGMPTWLYMPGATKLADGHYKGTLYRTTGGSWPTQEHYDSSATHVTTAGILDLAFTSDNAGTMTAVVDGKTIVNAIQRFGF